MILNGSRTTRCHLRMRHFPVDEKKKIKTRVLLGVGLAAFLGLLLPQKQCFDDCASPFPLYVYYHIWNIKKIRPLIGCFRSLLRHEA